VFENKQSCYQPSKIDASTYKHQFNNSYLTLEFNISYSNNTVHCNYPKNNAQSQPSSPDSNDLSFNDDPLSEIRANKPVQLPTTTRLPVPQSECANKLAQILTQPSSGASLILAVAAGHLNLTEMGLG
jgi:hypothetical protein